jgi:uncharacterized protein
MPANLTPQYKEAEERYRQAETPEQKLIALDEMMAVIPKHKGTEKLRADIKRRISKLKEREDGKSAHNRRSALYSVDKEGGGQIALVGPPNAGKSKLISRITNAQPDIGDYPFTTQLPLPGMMEYEDIKIQIVDIPPITEEFAEPWVIAIARNADAMLLVVDASDGSVLEEIEATMQTLEKHRIKPYGWDRPIPGGTDTAKAAKTILVANKMDQSGSPENLDIIRELYGDRFPIAPISAASGAGIEDLKVQIFRMLEIIRVYTKVPGKSADKASPFVLPFGSTVDDLAMTVHKDFAQKLRFARIWGQGNFDGQMVSRDHVLRDGDVIELHV